MRRIGAVMLLVGVVMFVAAPAMAGGPEENNWYVCKYVGPPGTNEVLQTGQNPIFVDENSIMADTGLDTVSVGDIFPDAQGHSVVVAGPYAPPGLGQGNEPECPVSTPSPTPTTAPPPPTPTVSPTVTTVSPTPTPTPTPSESPTESPSASPTPPLGHHEKRNKPPTKRVQAELAFTGAEEIRLAGLALMLFGAGLWLIAWGRKYA